MAIQADDLEPSPITPQLIDLAQKMENVTRVWKEVNKSVLQRQESHLLHKWPSERLFQLLQIKKDQLTQDEQLLLFVSLANFGTEASGLRLPEKTKFFLVQNSMMPFFISLAQQWGIEHLAEQHTLVAWIELTKALVLNTQLGDGTTWKKLLNRYFMREPTDFKAVVLTLTMADLKTSPITSNLLNPQSQAHYIENTIIPYYDRHIPPK